MIDKTLENVSEEEERIILTVGSVRPVQDFQYLLTHPQTTGADIQSAGIVAERQRTNKINTSKDKITWVTTSLKPTNQNITNIPLSYRIR